MNGKLRQQDATVGQLRGNIQHQLDSLCFASQLWSIFRAIVGGTLKSLGRQLGCTVEAIMSAIDTRVEEFFVSSLQLDVLTMELEHE